MLITNESKTHLINRMETFDTNITPVRRNVARKSTANRPLLNTILKDPLADYNENEFISCEKTSRTNNFTNYGSYKSSDFGMYYKDDINDLSKRSLLKENLNLLEETTLDNIDEVDNSSLQEDSDEEDLSGIFSVSDVMTKYVDESMLSPITNYDSSEEPIDFSRVRNYPMKQEKYSKNDKLSVSSVSSKNILPTNSPLLKSCANIKQELAFDLPKVEPVITSNSPISDDNNIITTELGTETKQCLFDPNLESVKCKVNVREEVLLMENVPLKMTIFEANFDVNQLENKVDESSYKAESENERDDMSIVPQVICAMSLENIENGEVKETPNTEVVESEKKRKKKPKRVSLKHEKVDTTVNVKRMTRSKASQMQVNLCAKRITRNSTRLNPDSLIKLGETNNEGNLVNNNCDNQLLDNITANDESQNHPHSDKCDQTKLPDISCDKINVHSSDNSKDEKSDSKKKNIFEKKGKKDINEGVLLHVEATKETELMRDGKIVKDKEEYLKDIESKIDKNLPVVVEKEFDIQQSLTEEILLDQALRLAHQRTSPRLSKVMKEALLKASIQKPNPKSKQQKLNGDKSETKLKDIKSSDMQKNTSDESELTESPLNTSSSESVSDVSCSSEPLKEIDTKSGPNEIEKKKENFIVTPVIKQSNVENIVEPLTIKICRKLKKKKSGLRFSSKKKKSPKKNDTNISKPVCSNAVDMDDLSKTFEDIIHDDSWCSEDKSNSENLDLIADNEVISKLSESTERNHSVSAKNNSDSEIPITNEAKKTINNKPEMFKTNETDKETRLDNVTLSDTNIPIEDKVEAISEQTSMNDESVSNKNNIPTMDGIGVLVLNKKPLHDETSICFTSTTRNDTPESNVISKNYEQINDTNSGTASANQDNISLTTNYTTDNSFSPLKPNEEGARKLNSLPTESQIKANSGLLKENVQSSISQNELPLEDSQTLKNNLSDKPLLSTNIVPNNQNYQQNSQFTYKDLDSFQEQSVDQLKQSPTNPDVQSKVVPLSIVARDPRLRKSQVILEENTSVSNPVVEESKIHQETKVTSHPIENVSTEIDKKDAESDQETSENFLELERKKKFKKKEVDSELLYKTPLSDLHVPERLSYARPIHKRSPSQNDPRDFRNRKKDNNFFQNTDRVPEYREFHEINMVYSKVSLYDPSRTKMVSSDEFNRNDRFPEYRQSEQYGLDFHQPVNYPSYRGNECPPDLRRRDSFIQSSSNEYVHNVRHEEFSEWHSIHTHHSDYRRLSYQHKESDQALRHSENFPPNYEPPDSYSRPFNRPNDFNLHHGNHGFLDFREREVRERLLERNRVCHNEPSYSRWDYDHTMGHFPVEVDKASGMEEENSQPDNINTWEDERDLIDGPMKKFSTKPFYHRKKFSRGEELFERRSTAWDVENRHYNDGDRNYERSWVRKANQEIIHGPERWDRRDRKPYREDRSRSPRRDHDRFPGKYNRSSGNYLKNKRDSSPSPHNSTLVLDSPMSPEPADRFCVLEPIKCLTVPQ